MFCLALLGNDEYFVVGGMKFARIFVNIVEILFFGLFFKVYILQGNPFYYFAISSRFPNFSVRLV